MELAKDKKQKAKAGPSLELQALIEIGIPLKMAIFNKTVLSWKNEPENALYSQGSTKVSRTAKLWYTPHGIVVDQGDGAFYKIIPLANVSDTIVL